MNARLEFCVFFVYFTCLTLKKKAIFSIIPANEKDTEKDRYVFVEKKTTDNFIKVNGENVQNLILKLNYGANFGIKQ